jgi:cobyrinic acid a,c-diamide synthase
LAVEQAAGVPVLGWLPKDLDLSIPERHLGLVPTNERGELTNLINHAADAIEQHFDLERILAISGESETKHHDDKGGTSPLVGQSTPDSVRHRPDHPPTIAVARDEAFGFYYEDNLDLLRESGARIAFFSPRTDGTLPPDTNGIYIGGGFPEIYAVDLASNSSLKIALQQAHVANMPIYAECGGFMYLSQSIIDLDGQQHRMVGLLPGTTRMEPRLMSLGYRVVESPTGNFLLPRGVSTRGHEFHWSSWDSPGDTPAWYIRPRQDSETPRPDGYARGNLIASYVHLHFAHEPGIAPRFVAACRTWAADNK